jgi:regulator of replication initiation timing
MADKLQLLEDKVGQVLTRIEELKTANLSLVSENQHLKAQLGRLEKEFNQFRLEHNDQGTVIKAKLVNVLNRIEELEKIGL